MRIFWLGTLVMVGLGLLMTIAPAAPVLAHTGFEFSVPDDGATVTENVDQIAITFSGTATPAGEGFLVLDPSGTVRVPDTVAADADQLTWTLGFNPPLAQGQVAVRWTVQAPDAHPISGSFSFVISSPPVDNATNAPDTLGNGLDPLSGGAQSAPGTESGSGETQPEGSTRLGTTDLDSFLQLDGAGPPAASEAGAVGRLLAVAGTMMAIGGMGFGTVVVRNQRRDYQLVLRIVGYAAVVLVGGTIIDLAANLTASGNGWASILAFDTIRSVGGSAYGLAIGLRVGAGVLLLAASHSSRETNSKAESLLIERELAFSINSPRIVNSSPIVSTHQWPPPSVH